MCREGCREENRRREERGYEHREEETEKNRRCSRYVFKPRASQITDPSPLPQIAQLKENPNCSLSTLLTTQIKPQRIKTPVQKPTSTTTNGSHKRTPSHPSSNTIIHQHAKAIPNKHTQNQYYTFLLFFPSSSSSNCPSVLVTVLTPSTNFVRKITFAFVNMPSFRLTTMN